MIEEILTVALLSLLIIAAFLMTIHLTIYFIVTRKYEERYYDKLKELSEGRFKEEAVQSLINRINHFVPDGEDKYTKLPEGIHVWTHVYVDAGGFLFRPRSEITVTIESSVQREVDEFTIRLNPETGCPRGLYRTMDLKRGLQDAATIYVSDASAKRMICYGKMEEDFVEARRVAGLYADALKSYKLLEEIDKLHSMVRRGDNRRDELNRLTEKMKDELKEKRIST